MARYFKCCILLLGLLFASCQEGGEAGDLFGQWRLKESDDIYISFSGSIVCVQSVKEGRVFGNFQHVGDSLFMQYYSIDGTAADTAIVERTFGFSPFSDVRLRIVTLDGDALELSKVWAGGGGEWLFYKY